MNSIKYYDIGNTGRVFLIVIISLFFSACSVPRTSIYVDNSICVNSLTSAIYKTIKSDLDENQIKELNQNIKNIENSFYKTYMKQELNHFKFTVDGTNYSYLFQNQNEVCTIKLYQEKKKNSTYTNTLTFINSSSLKGCKCGKNDYQIDFLP